MEASTPHEQIQVERTGGVARIALDRPDALNPLSVGMANEVRGVLAEVAEDETARAVLIHGSGRAFSSGADLGGGDMKLTEEGKPDVLTNLRDSYNPLILAVRELPLPVVAAFNGPAVGVGCSLGLACDYVVAAREAYLLMAFVNIGLTLDGGASVFLAAKAGAARAAEMGLLGERIDAERALQWGLVNEIAGDGEAAIERGREVAEQLAQGPTRSYAETKQLLHESAYRDLAAQLDREAVAQQRMAESEDFMAGVQAFLSKEKPSFKGR